MLSPTPPSLERGTAPRGAAGLAATGPITAWIVSIAGAMVLIFLLKAIGIFK